MATTTVRIEGAEELQAAFYRLKAAARGSALEKAAMAGAEVIAAAAKSRAPGPHVESEVLKASEEAIEVGIGPDKAHWYYAFFETGVSRHKITPTKKKGLAFAGREGAIVRQVVQHVGMAARPFLRPALEGSADEATAAVGAELRKRIDGAARG